MVQDVAFYDYDAKYIDNKITMDIPAKISDDVVAVMRRNAKQPSVQSVASVCLVVRLPEIRAEIYLNELQYHIGFTQWSALIHCFLGQYGDQLP